jgi:hypothetical protein
MEGHIIVDTSTGEDYPGFVTNFLGFTDEVIGVDGDTVAADHTRGIAMEVPLSGGCVEDISGIDTEAFEDKAQFINEGDIKVALDVFDNLGGFGGLDTFSLKDAAADRGVDLGDGIGGFGVETADNLD